MRRCLPGTVLLAVASLACERRPSASEPRPVSAAGHAVIASALPSARADSSAAAEAPALPASGQASSLLPPLAHSNEAAKALPGEASLEATAALPALDAPPLPLLRGGGPNSVAADFGAVTSSEAQATRAGVSVLERGGNAVDAAVATAFALAVTHPSAGNIGGGGFMLLRSPSEPTIALDFREVAPAALTRAIFERMLRSGGRGCAAVGVPGSVAGLLLAEERFGKLGRKRVLLPAIELARQGFVLGARPAALLQSSYPKLLADAVLGRRLGKNGKPFTSGTKIRLPELARTLERISEEGESAFYGPELAEAFERTKGCLVTGADLAAYRPRFREPLQMNYRGFVIETMPPPSAGGVALAELMTVLAALKAPPLAGQSARRENADDYHLFIEASRRAQAERRYGVVDPDALSAELSAERRARWTSAEALLARAPIELGRATPSRSLASTFPGAQPESEQTTHLSVVDAQGMVVSLTTTLSGSFGAEISLGQTGVVLNNSVASFNTRGENQPAPGRRTVSSMAPTLVRSGDEVVLVVGTPGGDTIPSTIARILIGVIDHGLTLDEAVNAPRLHHGFLPDQVRLESGRPIAASLRQSLEARGHRFVTRPLAMGDSNDILLEGKRAFALADPRGKGLALAARAPTTSSD